MSQTPLEVAQSLSQSQAQALKDARAGRPVLNQKAARRLQARNLVVHRSENYYDPTDDGVRVLAHL